MDERLLSPEELPEDINEALGASKSLRPKNLSEFIGQKQVCENLSIFIRASKEREEALDHVLFSGPPGLGKTTLAQVIASELGVNFRSTSGPIIARAGDLAAILTNLQPRDVLFIDEIHRLNPAVEEVLYPAMEDQKLDLMIGEGPAARSIQIDLPPFTLVGATTRAGLITRPLRERFGIPTALNFYEVDDLMHILTRAAGLLGMNLLEEGGMEIAKRSRGTPRIAMRLLRRVRDITQVEGCLEVARPDADLALKRLSVDAEGLDSMDRRYLRVVIENYGGGPVGVETIAAALSEQRDVLEEVVEPYLMAIGFIMRTPRGRAITERGYSHLGILPPQTKGSSDLFSFDGGEES